MDTKNAGIKFEKVSEDKYYVKPGTIFVSSEAIFLGCEGQLTPVTFIECDEEGVFVRPNAFKWGSAQNSDYKAR